MKCLKNMQMETTYMKILKRGSGVVFLIDILLKMGSKP